MDWQQYETSVLLEIESLFPGAKVSFDLKLMGQFSQTKRQCDVVVEERVGEERVRTLIDAKYRKRKINVKDVEEFVGLLRDVNCDRGIIVAANGFTAAAENLAFYGDTDVDLDVFNFDDLQNFQGIGAIPYSSQLGLLIRSPLGWITDANKREGMLASFYQRGLSFDEALQRLELIYLNFWHLAENENFDDVIQRQEENLKDFYPNGLQIGYSSVDCGTNGVMKVREVEFIGADRFEITAFLLIEQNVVFGVLHTPKIQSKKNRRKLVHMLALASPIKMRLR